VLLVTQGILVLQPTHTQTQKRQGAHVHAAFNMTGVAALLAGLVIIEYNKFSHHGAHFKSVHATLGLVTSALLIVQALIGLTQFYTPALYGSVANAKKIYKYHRMAGYAVLGLALATIIAATQTAYSRAVLHINVWAVVVAALLVVAGVVPRIRLQKFGFQQQSRP
jgi:hydrogenase maturation factor HypF (carbamoyltransferase family)